MVTFTKAEDITLIELDDDECIRVYEYQDGLTVDSSSFNTLNRKNVLELRNALDKYLLKEESND